MTFPQPWPHPSDLPPADPNDVPDASGSGYSMPAASRAAEPAPGGSRFAKRPAGLIKNEGGKLEPLSVRLERLGLKTEWDYLLYLPLRYEDETAVQVIGSLRPGEFSQVQGVVERAQIEATPRGQQFTAIVADRSGRLKLRFIHYYPSVQKQLQTGRVVRIQGEPREAFGGGLEIIHPKIKPAVADQADLPSALTPVYPLGEHIQQRWLRDRIGRALLDLAGVEDLVPESVTRSLGLPGLMTSLNYLHHPPAGASADALASRTDPHWQRLKFDELLAQQIALRQTRLLAAKDAAEPLPAESSALIDDFLRRLPFALTGAQQRVWREIEADLAKPEPMNRLVQGDVGSGKTVVAALAALRAVASGKQAALMAPTEILAEQHFQKIADWLEPLGIEVAWLTGRQKTAARRASLEAIASGKAQIAVGTHALIQEAVTFRNLALAIVDEQHRFGVAQRLALRSRVSSEQADGQAPCVPHLLMLSATPIPRTLAMSYLADLDVSVIDELPPGRSPIVTKTVRLDRRDDVVRVVRATAKEGRQVYWVCPLIDESEKLELTPAIQCAEDLARRLPELCVGLMHSGLSSEEKNDVMRRFSSGEISVLVSTTVIEVGVDVPNATLMVIEHAERFGLAQLHQLRGRVGRGSQKSACILLYGEPLSEDGKERLRAIRETTDGFEIARRDLQLRGPGEFLGERQSGMPFLRFADPEADGALLAVARDAAASFLAQDPERALRHARRWFSVKADYLSA